MTGIGTNTAFAKLLEYEKRAAAFRPGSREGHGPADEWTGIVFRLAGQRVTCNIDRISEILPCAPSTAVPGAKPWIIGLANVRGELLTVIDLAGYLSGTPSTPGPGSRLLAASLSKAPIGLLVDEVLGQRHFLDSDAQPAELDDGSPLQGVVARQHPLGAETWYELDLDRLFTSPEFLHGAAT
ncbi:MAG: chemotaxis protein CheW [Xanthomonadales bacterium]